MGKQAVSRFETGERQETLIHKELFSFLAFITQKGLLEEYFVWRFGFKVRRNFYKKGTPMDDEKY